MNEALANPMNSTPWPTSTARSGWVVLSGSVTAAGYLLFGQVVASNHNAKQEAVEIRGQIQP
jgi:hypothetical protein